MPDPTKVHAVQGSALTIAATGKALSDDSKLRLRSQLKNALNAELASHGNTLGLKPGDTVAISSSVGQSISF
jgi:hypothetical protein